MKPQPTKQQSKKGKMKKVKIEASIPFLLMHAGNHLDYAMDWLPSMRDNASSGPFENMIQAEALIEVVEIIDCGSVGGFGKGQGQDCSTLFRRWVWLCKKYWPDYTKADNEGNGQSYFSYVNMEKFYEQTTSEE